MNRCAGFLLIFAVCAGCGKSPEARKQQALERGKQHLTSRDYTRAILEFKTATQVAPRDAEAHFQLGSAYLAARDLRSAVSSFQRATEVDPNHVEAQVKLAEIYSGTRDTGLLKDAEQRMQAVLSTNANNADALRTLANAEFGLGELDEAEKHLAAAVAAAPGNLNATVQLAKLRISQNRVAEAEQILRTAADQKPVTATAAVVLGGFYLGLNRHLDAKREFVRALNVDKDNPVALLYLGSLQLSVGERENAEQTYKRLSNLREFRTMYGVFLLHTGNLDKAIQEFERLSAADPADRRTRTRLVAAYLTAGRKSVAQRILDAALKKDANDSDALLQRSSILLADGRYSEADAALLQVIKLDPNSAQAHFLLARIHEYRGNAQSQRQELAEAVRLKPNMLAARIQLANLLIRSNAAKSALHLMNETPASQRRTAEAVSVTNWALYALGDKEQMRRGLAEGLAIARAPDLLLQSAILKIEAGEINPARALIHEVLQRNPEETRALDLLTLTYEREKQAAFSLRKIQEYAAANPRSARLQQYLGTALQRSGADKEARDAFRAAKLADSTFWQADLALAALDVAEKNLPGARNLLSPLVSHPDAGVQARLMLAFVEENSGNGAAAVDHYRQVVKLQPDNVLALNNLAVALAEHANTADEALGMAQRAKELAPDNATVDDTLGWVFFKKGLYGSAVQYLESSVKRQPTAIRHAHLAAAYAKRGDTARGNEHLRAAIKLNGTAPEVVAARKFLAEAR